jgi:hypothetical protein
MTSRPLRQRSKQETHDYTRRHWGHDFTITKVLHDGRELRATGWGHGLRKGDYLLLPNGDATTRYRIENVTYFGDPGDMWKAVLRFAPREVGVPA